MPKVIAVAIISFGILALVIDHKITNNTSEKGAVDSPAVELTEPQNSILGESIAASEIPAKTTSDQIKVIAAGAYLMGSNEPLYAFKSGKQWPIASVTKLMTALAARKLIPPTEVITMSKEAVDAEGVVGDFKEGERFTNADLVQAMLVGSSNDAATAVAERYGQDSFIAAMNELAATIGMTNTVFVDPTGLSSRNLSTPDDLSRLVRFIWNEDPQIFTITRLKTVTIIDIDGDRSRKLNSTNLFAGRADFLGGKTGHIPDSNGNLVTIFSLEDKSSPVIIIVLGAEDRFQETEKILMKL